MPEATNHVTEEEASAEDLPHILFVDDERPLHHALARLFSRHGLRMTSSSNGREAIELLEQQSFDLVLTDFMMPEVDGLDLLAHVRRNYPSVRVIMITAHANVQHAVRAMKSGVVDYVPKPFSTQALIERLKTQVAEKRREEAAQEKQAAAPSGSAARAKKKAARSTTAKPTTTGAASTQYIGEHPSIQKIRDLLPRVAQSRAPVFVHGESGTGKEIMARLIHETSRRADQPYVTLNCANLPSELVESHLFGHRKGAFTGAVEDMEGAFSHADGGTLLLDEVTEVTPEVQAKLLRVLQEQEFQKVGAPKKQKVDVRVIATSNRDLDDAVEQGLFRADLYHRLAVFPLHLPPLRKRISDVPLLVEHFVETYCTLYEMPPKRVAPELMRRLQAYAWPGNVRQLENMIHRGVVLAAENEVIASADVVNDFFSGTKSIGADTAKEKITEGEVQTIEEMERHMILQALEEEGTNQKSAAERLGISARTIRNKLQKYRDEGFMV